MCFCGILECFKVTNEFLFHFKFGVGNGQGALFIP